MKKTPLFENILFLEGKKFKNTYFHLIIFYLEKEYRLHLRPHQDWLWSKQHQGYLHSQPQEGSG